MIETMVGFVDQFLNTLSETQFGALASSLGTTGMLLATLAAMLVAFNMMMQFYYIDTAESIKIIVKISFIAWLFRDWNNFNFLASGILGLLDNTGAALITAVNNNGSEAPANAASIPIAMDQLLTSLGQYGAKIAENLGVFGGPIFSFGVMILNAILGALTVFIICLAKITMSALIALAPLMLILTFFEATKPWFERWVSALITFALFPVIIAGVFATIIGMIRLFIGTVTEANDLSNVGEATGMFIVIILSIALIPAIPMIARMLSGNVVSSLPGLQGGLRSVGKAAQMAAGLAPSRPNQQAQTTANSSNAPGASIPNATSGPAKPGPSRQLMQTRRIEDRFARFQRRNKP